MDSPLQTVVDHIADQVDDLLADAGTRSQARTSIAQLLESDYPSVAAADRAKIVDAVMAILEREEFFAGPAGSEARVEDDRDAK